MPYAIKATLNRALTLTGFLLALTLPACSSGEIHADTSCKDFMAAPYAERNDAVSRIASDFGASAAVTPLGRPAVEAICTASPSRSIGGVIQSIR